MNWAIKEVPTFYYLSNEINVNILVAVKSYKSTGLWLTDFHQFLMKNVTKYHNGRLKKFSLQLNHATKKEYLVYM